MNTTHALELNEMVMKRSVNALELNEMVMKRDDMLEKMTKKKVSEHRGRRNCGAMGGCPLHTPNFETVGALPPPPQPSMKSLTFDLPRRISSQCGGERSYLAAFFIKAIF